MFDDAEFYRQRRTGCDLIAASILFGNRALTGLQFAASPNVVFDAEYELNLLPMPGVNQHAIDVGITLRPR